MKPAPTDEKARQIILAARTILARKGYSETTISQVAQEAGVSRGLLHYYFKSKEDLLAQVVHSSAETSLAMVGAVFQRSTAEQIIADLTHFIRHIQTLDQDFFNLFYESWAVARQNPAVAAELRLLFQSFRAALYQGLNDAVERGVITPILPLDSLASLLMGIVDGLILQVLTEPELSQQDNLWMTTQQTLRSLLTGS